MLPLPPATSPPQPQQSRELRILALASPPACLKAPGINQTEGTLSYQWRVPNATAPCNLLSLSDGTTNNRHQHYSENNFIIVRTASSGAASNNGVGPSSANSFTKVSFGYGSGTTSASDNGTEITTSTQAIPSNITTAYLGASATGAVGQAAILSRITYWPTRLGNEVLQRITQ
jgi:hypothetical protein